MRSDHDLPLEKKYKLIIKCSQLDSDPVAQNLAYTLYTLEQISATGLAEAMQLASIRAKATFKSYESWVNDGLPMWPWELFVNGFRMDDFAKPAPRQQWVFFRPNIAPALITGSEKTAELDYGLTLEIGNVWYRGTGYKRMVGVVWPWQRSPMSAGVGYGGLFRWNEYTVGVARHPRNDDTLVYVSVDLYKLIAGKDGREGSFNVLLENAREQAGFGGQ
ncbi:MAG: hypothetical protein U5O39_12555 [Gammaproteobacteria bacterium]|nr:hypothetical protein [Gammaproteobacteria bacterium]